MVCSFFYRTIPILIFMCLYWVYCKITGKDQEPEPQAEGEKKEANTSNCPYHICMAMMGFPVKPKEKKVEVAEEVTSESISKGIKVD